MPVLYPVQSVFNPTINIAFETNELYTPYKYPEREFRSSRRHFKTLSLDELRSPDFNLLYDEDYSEEEEEEEMAETMEQYMSKTRTDYVSGVARPKIDNKDQFELKGQFLKELRENTFSGSDNEDANEHIEKVLEIVDLFHVPNITIKKVNEKVYAAQVGCEQCKGPHYTKDFPQKEEGKTLEEAYYTQFGGPFQGGGYRATTPGEGFGSLPSSTETNPRDQVKSISTSIKADSNSICRIRSNQYDVPLILERPFLSTARAKIDVYKRKITLRVGEEKIIFKSVKPASNPFLEDYIELNDLNEPFELRRNQGNDLMPTIEEGEVIEDFRTRNEDLDTGIDDYPSYCDDDKKIHIDCGHNLKFSCMIGFEFTHANFFSLLYVNMMSRKFHNSIMKNKMVYKGNNVVGAFMNVPIFVGTFSVMTGFVVLETMDAYPDEGMGDVIFGEPFLREAYIKAKLFEGMITLYKGDDEVTYQMVRSHPRFKHHTNEQCNKIPPLLKVNEKDVMNGVSHAYQKLKGFYKGVLNLGPDYIRNTKTEEWLTAEKTHAAHQRA
ncbi:hypothetical protein Tco_0564998 [Tanacetum coccineum]